MAQVGPLGDEQKPQTELPKSGRSREDTIYQNSSIYFLGQKWVKLARAIWITEKTPIFGSHWKFLPIQKCFVEGFHARNIPSMELTYHTSGRGKSFNIPWVGIC